MGGCWRNNLEMGVRSFLVICLKSLKGVDDMDDKYKIGLACTYESVLRAKELNTKIDGHILDFSRGEETRVCEIVLPRVRLFFPGHRREDPILDVYLHEDEGDKSFGDEKLDDVFKDVRDDDPVRSLLMSDDHDMNWYGADVSIGDYVDGRRRFESNADVDVVQNDREITMHTERETDEQSSA
ncbi:Uncharacterized protein Fot_28900 [Forsythia ovata]|uniref:Uncharacterized protein n=1 Tax=Forsythia ovata TaxID=205694 RepID=A0ABD1TQF4_9LAMI